MSSVLLTQAVSSGDESAVSALLANGADVNERTSGGQTPLILATIFGHTHLLPLLLDAGADPQLRDNLGLNAIDWAQRRGANDAIQLFNEHKTPAAATPEPEAITPAPPPSRNERDSARSGDGGEKSQRWLAGLKQRIAEQSHGEVPDGTNIFRAQPEPQRAETEPQIPKIEEPQPARAVAETNPAPPTTTKQNPAPKTTRKRCPQCGEIYNSDLLAYCAHHVVELVDADELPVISEPQRTSSPVLFWLIIGITLAGSLVIGSLITFFYSGNSVTPQTAAGSGASPSPRAVQKGVPSPEPELERKATALPIAECPLNGEQAIPGTVTVHVVINKEGQVISARASGGDWLLRGAATEAAMKSAFSPEKLRGRETEGTITYTFEP